MANINSLQNLYTTSAMHVRVSAYYYYALSDFGEKQKQKQKMHFSTRVILFFILVFLLPLILILTSLYLRRHVYGDVTYLVAESDVIEIREGISSIFCSQHSLHMKRPFNAFQLPNKPKISANRKHIRLKKSMTLPDDTLEYWGFYLLKGAMVHLKFCSRYNGSRIMVVRGERELKTCGLLNHNKNKVGANLAKDHEKVQVFFENMAETVEDANADYLMELENHSAENFDTDNESYEILKPTISSIMLTKLYNIDLKSKSRKWDGMGSVGKVLNNATKDLKKAPFNTTKIPTLTAQHKNSQFQSRKQQVFNQLFKHRARRDHIYDRKYSHGGNALNFIEADESNSISSFESDLYDCYNGNILLAEGFPPTVECISYHFLESGTHRMVSKHEVTADGYYYYIFYSDNDLMRNEIHAIFDIYKPTFQYSNISKAGDCINVTNCTFNITFLSDELVIVEMPTRYGIELEEDNTAYLTSICHPRTEVYAIFPIAVLLLIIYCSFL